jgi:hypothetical protein
MIVWSTDRDWPLGEVPEMEAVRELPRRVSLSLPRILVITVAA